VRSSDPYASSCWRIPHIGVGALRQVLVPIQCVLLSELQFHDVPNAPSGVFFCLRFRQLVYAFPDHLQVVQRQIVDSDPFNLVAVLLLHDLPGELDAVVNGRVRNAEDEDHIVQREVGHGASGKALVDFAIVQKDHQLLPLGVGITDSLEHDLDVVAGHGFLLGFVHEQDLAVLSGYGSTHAN
jgi:hypothetical protein